MKAIAVVSSLAAGLWLGISGANASAVPADAEFARISDEFMTGYLAWRPLSATMLGLHEYDGKITDFSRGSIDAELARLLRFEKQIAEIKAASLSAAAEYDRQILLAGIRTELFHFRELAVYTRNPMTYAGALDLNIYAKRDFAPAEQRLRSLVAIEKQAPA